MMQSKDYITLLLSGAALIVSLISIIITLIQKYRETQRNIRKTLTDTLENITKITIETSKLLATKNYDFSSEPNILLRRNFNAQRRLLISHASYLILRYDKIATEIDCNVLAQAYSIIGDQENAELFWNKTVEKSKSNPIKAMNLRGFGMFLFNNGRPEFGRKYFIESLSVELPDNDGANAIVFDTYLMLADVEFEFGNNDNRELAMIKAMEVLAKIGSKKRKQELQKRISERLNKKLI